MITLAISESVLQLCNDKLRYMFFGSGMSMLFGLFYATSIFNCFIIVFGCVAAAHFAGYHSLLG